MTTTNERPLITFVIHCYYPAQFRIILRKIEQCLTGSGIHFNMIVGYSEDSCKSIARSLDIMSNTGSFDGFKFIKISNAGRNFATLLDKSVLAEVSGYTILHLHTKKSPHLPKFLGHLWLMAMLNYLLPRGSRLKARARRLVEKESIAFAPIDLFFLPRSRRLMAADTFFKSSLLTIEKQKTSTGDIVRFPAGAMFHAESSSFINWAERVVSCGPIFRRHNSISGETEHYLERDLGDYYSPTGRFSTNFFRGGLRNGDTSKTS